MLAERIKTTPVVPLIQADDPDVAVRTVEALQAGGLDIIEVVLRTDKAMECMAAIAKERDTAFVGAGTVLTKAQAEECVSRGAQFIVSPGLDEAVVGFCQEKDLSIFPGTVTATEMQQAWNLGLRTVKFFPASLSGGTKMLKALSSVFRGLSFMPTGGVSANNLEEYLSIPAVVACGGSWLTPADEIAAGNYGAVTELAEEALSIAKRVRG